MTTDKPMDLISFGEVLWDIIEGVPHLGGAPFNLAAHASLCGLNTAVVSALGQDDLGAKALSRAKEIGINTRWMTTTSEHPTGTVIVKLVDAMPQYDIRKNAAWDNIVLSDRVVAEIAATQPKAFCFGTLAQRSDLSRTSLQKLLLALKGSLRFFDVNLRQHYWSAELIANGLKQTEWLKTNDEEALLLNAELFNDRGDLNSFAQNIFAQSNVAGVLITCGPDGCVVFERGAKPFKSPAVDAKIVDTIGAGDAFSAAFLSALLQGKSTEQAAQSGNERGALVASQPGAIPIDGCCQSNISHK